jgi:beta-N-acetylglucosaminidase
LREGGYIHGDYAELVSKPEPAKKLAALIKQPEDKKPISEPNNPTSVVESDSGLTQEHIKAIFEGTGLANKGLEDVVLEIEKDYGINAYFTIAVMKLESGNGESSLAKKKNNLFGLNAIDGDKNRAFSFKTKGDSVRKFGQLLAKNYVDRGYTTVEKVAKKYCPANPQWSGLVHSIMKNDFNKL